MRPQWRTQPSELLGSGPTGNGRDTLANINGDLMGPINNDAPNQNERPQQNDGPGLDGAIGGGWDMGLGGSRGSSGC